MWRNIGTRCYVPGCTKSSGLNPEFTFHRPRDRDTKTKWEAAIASRHPGVKKGLNVPHICSSHFADDAYVETDILQFRLGLAPKRRRLKHDAVPTLFQEQSLDMPCDEITSDSIRIKEEASSCSSSSPSSRENHGNAEDLMTRVCTEAMMAASVSISVKIEPEHTRSSIFLESQGNAEDYITGDYPPSTMFPDDSTHVKEEPRDTTFPFSMGNQRNGDSSTTDNYPAATTVGSVLTYIKKEPEDTRFSPPPGNNGNTETESVTESRTLASDSVAVKEETQDSSPSLPASHGNIEGPSTEYNLETTMVPSDFFRVKEEPRSASSSPVPGNDEKMEELLADEYPETTLAPSDFFRVKEEPRSASSSSVPGNDENMEELLADGYPEAEIDASGFISIKEESQGSTSSALPGIHKSTEKLITDNRPGKPEVIKWLMEHGALQKEMRCPLCRHPTALRLSPRTTGRWVCRRRGHYWSESVFYNSIFRNLRVPLDTFLHMMLIFARRAGTYSYIADNCTRGNKKLSNKTISRVLYLLRRAISAYMERRHAAEGKIGGRHKIVEIHESFFKKRADQNGRKVDGEWVLTMVERDPNKTHEGTKVRVVVCPNNSRDKATLITLIKRNVRRGTTIITRGRGSYSNLETLGENPQQWRRRQRENYYKHKVANQRTRFVNEHHVELHTRTAEWTWSVIERPLIRGGQKHRSLQLYLDEQMWHQELKISGNDPFFELLRCVGVAGSRVFTGKARLRHAQGVHNLNNRHKAAQTSAPACRPECKARAPRTRQPPKMPPAPLQATESSVASQPIQDVRTKKPEQSSTLSTPDKRDNAVHTHSRKSFSGGVAAVTHTGEPAVTLLTQVPLLQPILFVNTPVGIVQTLGSFIPVLNHTAPYVLQPLVNAQSLQQLVSSPSQPGYIFSSLHTL